MAKTSNARLIRVAIAVVVLLGIGVIALNARRESRRLASETATTWMIAGPACPVPAPGAATSPVTHQSAGLEDVAIAREVGGAVACETIKENGDGPTLKICQFITPGAIKVTTKKGTYRFSPPRGVDASIVVRDDVPSCVQHINPALFNLPSAGG